MAAKPFLDWSLVWGSLLSILTNLLGNITIHDIGESGSQPTSMKGRSRILIVVHMKLGVGQRIDAHRCRPANPTRKLLVPFLRTANKYDSWHAYTFEALAPCLLGENRKNCLLRVHIKTQTWISRTNSVDSYPGCSAVCHWNERTLGTNLPPFH